MKTKKFDTVVIVEVAIFAAIAFVLDLLQGQIWNLTPLFASGGSIGVAMVPIMIITFRRGILAGSICGLVTGFVQMLGGVSTIPVSDGWYNVMLQVSLDYALTYMMCGLFTGLVALFIKDNMPNKIKYSLILGACLLGGFGKFLCHFLAGAIYWQNFDLGSPYLYSLIYNGAYVLPSTILSMGVILVIYLKQPQLFYAKENIKRVEVSA